MQENENRKENEKKKHFLFKFISWLAKLILFEIPMANHLDFAELFVNTAQPETNERNLFT